MDIAIASDLHLEWHRDYGQSFIESLDPTGVDVLVLAGDIDSAKHLCVSLKAISEKYPQVVLVNGNHELYGFSPEQAHGAIHRAAKGTKTHWLNRSTVTIAGVRFVGATLWFPHPAQTAYKGGYNDFFQVRDFEPWVYEEHRATLDFLDRELKSTDILVTHFMPLRESIQPEYKASTLNCFFWAGEEADKIVRDRGPRLVIHGHTHSSVDYQLGTSRVLCNPFGYVRVGENRKFDLRLIVNVPEIEEDP
jgi:predicted phosphodiesterase